VDHCLNILCKKTGIVLDVREKIVKGCPADDENDAPYGGHDNEDFLLKAHAREIKIMVVMFLKV
jgi:hypothetical protein